MGEGDLRSKPLVDLLLRVTTGLPKELQHHLVSCDLLPELPELAAGRELQLVSGEEHLGVGSVGVASMFNCF